MWLGSVEDNAELLLTKKPRTWLGCLLAVIISDFGTIPFDCYSFFVHYFLLYISSHHKKLSYSTGSTWAMSVEILSTTNRRMSAKVTHGHCKWLDNVLWGIYHFLLVVCSSSFSILHHFWDITTLQCHVTVTVRSPSVMIFVKQLCTVYSWSVLLYSSMY